MLCQLALPTFLQKTGTVPSATWKPIGGCCRNCCKTYQINPLDVEGFALVEAQAHAGKEAESSG